ncbi:hypothetical protein IW148_004850, partial [Coemansia sp. RSA 1199]
MSALMAVDAATSQSTSPNMDADGYSSTTSSTPSVYVEIIRHPRRAGTSKFAPEVSVQSGPSQAPSNTATPLLLGVHRNTELILQTPLNNHNLLQQVVQQASSSSAKAHGTIIDVSGDFSTIARQGGLVLDKSLICKALLDTPSAPIRVCLPRRFGKTFNLSVIEEFFNVITCKDAEPVDGSIDEAAGRANRMKLFDDSLLHEEHPEFFEEHFCKTPVIRITMKNVKATSVEEFYKALVGSIYDTAKIWVSNAKNVDWSAFVKDEWDDLKEITSEAKKILGKSSEQASSNFALYLYEALEEAVAKVEALVKKVLEQNPHLQRYSAELIVNTIVEWYGGYYFGIGICKFNPFAVTQFLMNLCGSSPDEAARCYWDRTGNQGLVNRIALSNRANMLILATEFLAGYGKDA